MLNIFVEPFLLRVRLWKAHKHDNSFENMFVVFPIKISEIAVGALSTQSPDWTLKNKRTGSFFCSTVQLPEATILGLNYENISWVMLVPVALHDCLFCAGLPIISRSCVFRSRCPASNRLILRRSLPNVAPHFRLHCPRNPSYRAERAKSSLIIWKCGRRDHLTAIRLVSEGMRCGAEERRRRVEGLR